MIFETITILLLDLVFKFDNKLLVKKLQVSVF